jgi:hypothetical protein
MVIRMSVVSCERSAESEIAEAWREAAHDLGLLITTPYVLATAGEAPVRFIALIRHFGSEAGTLITTLTADTPAVRRVANSATYFVSLLNAESYSRYDRKKFIDTLNDWRYFGADPPPPWYSGEPWS